MESKSSHQLTPCLTQKEWGGNYQTKSVLCFSFQLKYVFINKNSPLEIILDPIKMFSYKFKVLPRNNTNELSIYKLPLKAKSFSFKCDILNIKRNYKHRTCGLYVCKKCIILSGRPPRVRQVLWLGVRRTVHQELW